MPFVILATLSKLTNAVPILPHALPVFLSVKIAKFCELVLNSQNYKRAKLASTRIIEKTFNKSMFKKILSHAVAVL